MDKKECVRELVRLAKEKLEIAKDMRKMKKGKEYKFLKNEYERRGRRTKLIKALGGWRKDW